MNLVSNALDAMRQTPPGRRKVEISTAGNGDNEVRLSVRDHGTGIRTEVHERLFDRFFTTKEQGLGMGLAIVRSIVESHGGRHPGGECRRWRRALLFYFTGNEENMMAPDPSVFVIDDDHSSALLFQKQPVSSIGRLPYQTACA